MSTRVSLQSSDLKMSKQRLRNINDLVEAGLIESASPKFREIEQHYDIGVSDHVRSLMTNAQHDPIAQQYIPSEKELNIRPDEEADPIGDDVYSPVAGIVHRYPDRVLLKATNVCAVYCRYCFRKEMIGANSQHLSVDQLGNALSYISTHPEIWEVILTGGDPLVLSARRLQYIFDALEDMDHVRMVRVHTRIPVADPSKIDNTILSVLKGFSKSIQIVIHVNHVNEISHDVAAKIFDLRSVGCSILSQSVLLRGVNNDPKVLEVLFKRLAELHVIPYYLHHLDKARGTSHFRVKIEDGMRIMAALQGRISGTCIPKYMLDIPGGHGKIPINTVEELSEGLYRVKDHQGGVHLYTENMEEEVRA